MIKRFLVNGSEEKLSKSVLADEISSGLLPEATSEDDGKVVSVDATGGYVLSTIESELPAATSEDEGKVVAVGENGSYELAEAGGGGEFVVEFTFNGLPYAPTNVTCNRRYADIKQAIDAGKEIVAIAHLGAGTCKSRAVEIQRIVADDPFFAQFIYGGLVDATNYALNWFEVSIDRTDNVNMVHKKVSIT